MKQNLYTLFATPTLGTKNYKIKKYIAVKHILKIRNRIRNGFQTQTRAQRKGEPSVWLICRAVFGRGKNKLLVRGIEGAQWVFCPFIKNIKRDRVSIDRCQGCKHFIRLEQTYIPQTPTTRKTLFLRTTALKSTFHLARTLSRSKTKHQRVTLFHHIPSLTKERQPLIDIFEEQDHLIILAELPGVDEKDLNIKADEHTLTITANNNTKKYLKKVRLPTPIKKDRVKSTYSNNILQVRLEKLRATKHD